MFLAVDGGALNSLELMQFRWALLFAAGCASAVTTEDPTSGGGSGGAGDGGGNVAAPSCSPPLVGEADGQYFFTLSFHANPALPFTFDTVLTTQGSSDGGLLVNLSIQPLRPVFMDPVGFPLTFVDLPVAADGSFRWDLGEVTLIAEASKLFDTDFVTGLILTGYLCADSPFGFICGDVAGMSSLPAEYDLAGSTFSFQRYGETSFQGQPVWNCSGDPGF